MATRKMINKIIQKKIDDWINSIDDNDLKKLVKRDVIVTGGCITSMFLKEKINDYDIYFKTLETTFKVADYYAKKMALKYDEKHIYAQILEARSGGDFGWDPVEGGLENSDVKNYIPNKEEPLKYRVRCFIKSAGAVGDPETDLEEGSEESDEYVTIEPSLETIESEKEKDSKERKKYSPVYMSSNAITLSDKIQIILRFYGEPDVIHQNYDFVHVTNYWTYDTKLVTNIAALEAILAKQLRYVGSRYPLASIIRTRKFIRRGWSCNAGQYVKMAMQLNELDLCNIDVLEDQLTGVDVAYFHQVISYIKENKRDMPKEDFAPYFIEVVNKIFD